MVAEPVRALVEGTGGCIALVLVSPLAAAARGLEPRTWVRAASVAFAVAGALDLAHACVTAPVAAVWTRALATLVGGCAFAIVAARPTVSARRLIVAVVALAGAALAVVLSWPSWSRALELAGALGYFVAAWRFARGARRDGDAAALTAACAAFALSRLTLVVAPRGSLAAWSAHVLGLAGYLVIARHLVVRAQHAFAALRELEREKRAREEFVAGLAHDLRNPVHAAGLAAQLLVEGEVDASQQHHCAARIAASLQRVARMIEDFLDANLISAGHALPVQLARCDLVALAREVLADFGDDRRFVLAAPPELVGWWWHKGLRRAVENLVGNAIKYGDERAPVTVRIEAVGARVLLSVHNFGRALSLDEQQTIFAPFARTRSATASGERGWGIGLTLVRGTVEAHGGRVRVASRAGGGTTFTVELPRDARDKPVDGRARTIARPRAAADPPPPPVRSYS